MFVSTINLRSKKRQVIEAGVPFDKDQLVEATFDSLQKDGYVKEYSPEDPVQVVDNIKGLRLIGPSLKTPKDAVIPLKDPSKQVETEKEKLQKGLDAKGIKYDKRCGVKALRKKLAGAEKAKAEQIWDYDIEKLKEMAFPFMLAEYKTRCEKYNQVVEVFEDKEALIEKMTSQCGG